MKADEIKQAGRNGTYWYLYEYLLEQKELADFLKNGIVRSYPCGKGYVTGVPYARDKWNSGDFLERSGKTRDVNGVAAEKIAENVAKLDKKTGVLSRIYRATRSK